MNRNIALDILKFSMAFMVVGLHSRFLGDVSPVAEYLTVNGIFRISVPIFFIINGYFFYPVILRKQSFAWIKRIIILYIFWMIFYSPFWIKFPLLNSTSNLTSMVIEIYKGYYHLWYVAGMIGAACIQVALDKFSIRLGWILFLIVICFSCGVLIQYIGNYHFFANILLDKLFNLNAFHKNFLFVSFPFFCTGFLINKYEIRNVVTRGQAISLSILGLALLMCESYLNYLNLPFEASADNFSSLLVLCPAVFLLFLKFHVYGRGGDFPKFAGAIYFCHILVLLACKRFFEMEGTLLTLVVFFVSVLFAYLLIKIDRKIGYIL